MWLLLAFLSAAFLGVYDTFKKKALAGNAVIPVLFLNTLFCSLIFIPFIILSSCTHVLDGSILYVPQTDLYIQKFIILKSVIVLSSWMFGYFAIKHLPLTIVGPVNATRPVMVLIGALMFFSEKLNVYQWIGVILAVISFFLLSRSGKKEGIDFKHNRWVFFLVLAAMLGAISGLYDKYLLAPVSDGGLGINKMAVQCWFNVYQCIIMGMMLLLIWLPIRKKDVPLRWSWYIIGISLFLCTADFLYFYSLGFNGALISVVSMIRRSSVVVSFFFGAFVFHEKNLKSKIIDLTFVIIGMIFLFIGSR
jgi:transporter family protein